MSFEAAESIRMVKPKKSNQGHGNVFTVSTKLDITE